MNYSGQKIISIANKNPKKKYRILTIPTHERYETQLCKTGHEFFSLNIDGQKRWNEDQCAIPENYHILPQNDICSHLGYDFILSQSKFGQFQIFSQINQQLQLPIISLEHTLPLYGIQQDEAIFAMQQMVGNVNIFISEFSKNAWNIGIDSHVIHHGIDTNTFNKIEKQDHILSVANDFINRDYCLNFSGWKRVTDGLPKMVIGDTNGLSKAAGSVEELVSEYNKCGVFFNSSTRSPIPTSLLEAMSCGCAVVSTATCMIPYVIENGVNGFVSNDESELRKYLELLLEDKELRKNIGQQARKTILTDFAEDKFINNWNNLFDETYEVFYT